MRKLFYVPAILVLCCILSASASDFEDFVSDVDAEWAVQNYTNMLQVINQRLSTHTNDLAALLLAMNYYLAIDYNLTSAQNFVPVFTNAVASIDWSPDPEAELFCNVMILDVIDPQEAESIGIIFGLSSNELAELHAEYPTNNPLSEIILRIGTVQWSDE